MKILQENLETTPEYLYPILVTVIDNISPISFLGAPEFEIEKAPIKRIVTKPIVTSGGLPAIVTTNKELEEEKRSLFYIRLRGEKIGQISIIPINVNRSRVRIDLDSEAEGNTEAVTLVNRLADGICRIIKGQTEQPTAPAIDTSSQDEQINVIGFSLSPELDELKETLEGVVKCIGWPEIPKKDIEERLGLVYGRETTGFLKVSKPFFYRKLVPLAINYGLIDKDKGKYILVGTRKEALKRIETIILDLSKT